MFSIKVKFAATLLLAAGVLVGGGIVTSHVPKADASPAPAAAEVLRKLRQQRGETARRIFEEKMKGLRNDKVQPSDLFGWSQRWLEAELALSDKKEDQVAALKAHVERTRDLERLAVGTAKAGQGKQSDADAATYERIDADVRYFQATGEAPSPAAPKALREVLQQRRDTARRVFEGKLKLDLCPFLAAADQKASLLVGITGTTHNPYP